MGLLPLLFFLTEFIILNNAIPLPNNKTENTFYIALEEKCPYIKNITNFKSQEVFNRCTDWNKINETKILSKDTENNFLCLMYFDSFSLFCSEFNETVYKMPPRSVNVSGSYFTPTANDVKIEVICKNLSLFPAGKKFQHNITEILTKDSQCIKLCDTYTPEGTPVLECGLTYYFANLKVTDVIQNAKSIGKPQIVEAGSKTEGELNESQSKVNSPNVQPEAATSVGQVITENKPQNLPEQNTQNEIAGETKEAKVPAESNPQGKVSQPQEPTDLCAHDPSPDCSSPNSVEKGEDIQSGKAAPEVETVQTAGQQPAVASGAIADEGIFPPDVPKTSEKSRVSTTEHKIGESPDTNLALQEARKAQQPDTALETKAETNEDIETDLEESPPMDPDDASYFVVDDDEEQEYKKAEQEANKEAEEAKRRQDLKNEADTLLEKKNEQPETMDILPDMPISSANASDIDGESYFFSYFMAICVLFVLGYVGYHNRQKVMALVVEGKRGKRQYRGRRPNSANYHKLDSNLEEAISSSCTKNTSHVIY